MKRISALLLIAMLSMTAGCSVDFDAFGSKGKTVADAIETTTPVAERIVEITGVTVSEERAAKIDKIADTLERIETGGKTVGAIATSSAPVTGGWGAGAGTAITIGSVVAGALAGMLRKLSKTKKAAKSVMAAVDNTPGIGVKIMDHAARNGVAKEVAGIYHDN